MYFFVLISKKNWVRLSSPVYYFVSLHYLLGRGPFLKSWEEMLVILFFISRNVSFRFCKMGLKDDSFSRICEKRRLCLAKNQPCTFAKNSFVQSLEISGPFSWFWEIYFRDHYLWATFTLTIIPYFLPRIEVNHCN